MKNIEAPRGRLCFITGEFPPMRGGVGDYTRELGIALTHLGYEVHVITHVRAHTADQDERVASHLHVHPIIPRWDSSALHLLIHAIRKIRPRIVHIQYQTAAYHMHPTINIFPWLLKRGMPNLSTAITYHDLREPYLFPKAGPLRRWITYFPARQVRWVIATNREDEALLRSKGIAAVRIPIGPNVHPVPVSAEEVQDWRRELGIPDRAATIGYFGFLNRSKGALELVRAVALLRERGQDVHLIMLGDPLGASDPTNQAYLEEVKQAVTNLGLDTRIHWTGFLDDRGLSLGFAACDVIALPYRDGASLRRGTLQAALVHGAAIVSTRPRVSEVGADLKEAILTVEPQDPLALAQGIAALLNDPERARRLRERARALSHTFTWDKIAQRHAEVYEQ